MFAEHYLRVPILEFRSLSTAIFQRSTLIRLLQLNRSPRDSGLLGEWRNCVSGNRERLCGNTLARETRKHEANTRVSKYQIALKCPCSSISSQISLSPNVQRNIRGQIMNR